MDVRFSAEQQALRDSAAKVVGRLGPRSVRQLDDTERRTKLDAAVAAAGWRDLRTAADDGTPWASGVEVGIVAEQLGRGLADAPFLGPTLAAELRRLAGAPAAPASAPETVALTSDLGGLAVAGADTGAVAVDAEGASAALMLARRSGSGYGICRAGDISRNQNESSLDLTRQTAAIDVRARVEPVPDQGRVLTPEDVTTWTALGLATTCTDLVGAMRGALQLACDYAKDRRQYGRPIGSFQAVQHLLADAHVATEGAHSVAFHAAWAVDALSPSDALAAAAVAKAYCTRAARTVAETAIQVHGGIGNTWECLAHVYLRRVLLAGAVLGGIGSSLTRVLAHRGIDVGGARGLR